MLRLFKNFSFLRRRDELSPTVQYAASRAAVEKRKRRNTRRMREAANGGWRTLTREGLTTFIGQREERRIIIPGVNG